MKHSIKLISHYEYKKQFLPEITENILYNKSNIQLYKIESYLKDILIPVPPYRTSFNFLLVVTDGYIEQQLETENYKVKKSEALHIKQGNITRTLQLSPDLKGYFLIYENEVVTNLFLNNRELDFFFTEPYMRLSEQQLAWLEKSLSLLEEELQIIEYNNALNISLALFSAILLKIIQSAIPTEHKFTRELEITYQFRTLVHRHHIQHKEVAFYAREMQVSETYLNKCVKKTTGEPPKQWIQKISILHSQILLQNLAKEIAEIAYELNYQSASYFTRIFHKIVGATPKEYRMQLLDRHKNAWV
ncbi:MULTISPECIES: helix-turn-helix domain-containing protein [Chitinophagaceae]